MCGHRRIHCSRNKCFLENFWTLVSCFGCQISGFYHLITWTCIVYSCHDYGWLIHVCHTNPWIQLVKTFYYKYGSHIPYLAHWVTLRLKYCWIEDARGAIGEAFGPLHCTSYTIYTLSWTGQGRVSLSFRVRVCPSRISACEWIDWFHISQLVGLATTYMWTKFSLNKLRRYKLRSKISENSKVFLREIKS